MTGMIAVMCFWAAAGLLFYVYAGFPAVLAVAGRIRNRRVAAADITPPLTLIIAAYNEEACIAARLDNALAADYPRDALEIIIASDGSADRTAEIVESYAARGVRLLELPRRGKIFALNDAVLHARGEILVFSDANTMVERNALRALARNFADPEVGGVVGHTGYRLAAGSETAARGESLYWRYDTMLKVLESRTGSVVSAHGGLYALRRELYEPPADAAGTDDFMISTGVMVKGFRLVFERDARGWELPLATSSGEFRRRVRLMTRGIRAVANRRQLLDPRRQGFYSVVLFSHKVLRRLVPVGLLVLLATSMVLSSIGLYRWLLVGQASFYALAVVGFATRASVIGRSRMLYAPFFFCLANIAALAALYGYLRGARITRWEPHRHALRPPSAPTAAAAARTEVQSIDSAAASHVDFLAAGVVHVRAIDASPADVIGLERQLGRACSGVGGPPEITLRFVDRLPRQEMQHIEVGRSAFTAEGYMMCGAGRTCWVRVPFADAGSSCEFVCERGLRSVPLLDAFLRLAALGRGFLPFHASAFEWKGIGAIVAGWSHGGKTSALLSFGARGARYVGDDLVLVSADGREMCGIDVPVALSEWHLKQLPLVRRSAPYSKRLLGVAVQQMNHAVASSDAAGGGGIAGSLRLRSVARVAQRSTKLNVPVPKLFDGISTHARPRKLFLMLSAQQKHVSVEAMPAGLIAERMAHSLAAEAMPLLSAYNAYRFAGIGPANPLIESMAQRETVLLRSALHDLDGYMVRHPYPAPFTELFDAMRPWCET